MYKDLALPGTAILLQAGESARCLSNSFDHEPREKIMYYVLI